LMIMPDRVKALRHVHSLLRPGGLIYVTQTFEQQPNRLLELVKPLLKFLLTIDFGSVTYERDFIQTAAEAGLRVTLREVLQTRGERSFTLVVVE